MCTLFGAAGISALHRDLETLKASTEKRSHAAATETATDEKGPTQATIHSSRWTGKTVITQPKPYARALLSHHCRPKGRFNRSRTSNRPICKRPPRSHRSTWVKTLPDKSSASELSIGIARSIR